jgi:hypothetical protein
LTEISDDDEANESPDDKVEERPHRPMVPTGPERESGFLSPTGRKWPHFVRERGHPVEWT